MALIKKNQSTETAAVEEKASEATITQPAAETEVKTETKAVAAKTQAAPPAAATSGSFWMSNPAVQAIIDDAQYGDFPSIVASQGSFQIAGTNDDVGNIIEFKAVQAKVKLVCSPNSNDEEAKTFFAAAYEGETTMDGRTIEQCVEDAKTNGYEKADVKRYIDLFAVVTANASDKNDIEGEFVMLQLSPMSVAQWSKFSKKLQMQAAFGQLQVDEAPTIRATATLAQNAQKKSYTHYSFGLIPASK